MAPRKKPRNQLSKTAKYYRDNPKARAVKKKKDTEINRRTEQKKKRAELKRIRESAKRSGKKVDGKDYDHATGGFVKDSVNRGRKEKSRLKGSTRKKRLIKNKRR